MLNVENRFMIKDLYRKGVTISEIARRTGCDRKTIRTAGLPRSDSADWKICDCC